MLNQGLRTSFRAHQDPFNLRGRGLYPITMQFYDDFFGVRRFSISSIPERRRLTCREELWREKDVRNRADRGVRFFNPAKAPIAHEIP